MTEQVCHDCGAQYAKISQHWSLGDCSRPEVSDYQADVLRGILLGDGNVRLQQKHPSYRCKMTNRRFLVWLDSVMGHLSAGVRQEHDGFGNENPMYCWQSWSHPFLGRFNTWYSSGEKVFPKDIELTPTVLTMWYIADGHYKTGGSNRNFSIGCANEMNNKDKIASYFRRVDLPTPSNWNNHNIVWTKPASRELFKYMDEPPPGFSYKWPENISGTGPSIS